jgi:hypothetical protein
MNGASYEEAAFLAVSRYQKSDIFCTGAVTISFSGRFLWYELNTF